jgi:hypothetical protein
VRLPSVDLGVAQLPSVGVRVGLPPVRAGVDLYAVPVVPGLPPTASLPSRSFLAVAAADPVRSAHRSAAPSLSTPATHPVPSGATLVGLAVGAGRADGSGRLVSQLSAGVSLLAALGTSGAGTGVVPAGSASGGVSGMVLFALATVAGLAGLQAWHARPARDRSGHALRLLRQPGFCPD